MDARRLARSLFLLLWVTLIGMHPLVGATAAPTAHPAGSSANQQSLISAPRQSLPLPVHDEATCAFCQAAIFPPCAPQPADVSVAERGEVRRERPAPDARVPHTTADRPASSRAPPPLRFA